MNLTIAAYVRISEKLIDMGVLPNDHLDAIMDWEMKEHRSQHRHKKVDD